MLFSGTGNSIFVSREYYLDFSCEFILTYYPFDTQVRAIRKVFFPIKQAIIFCLLQMCQMDFEITGKTDNWLRVEQEVDGVELLCK